MGALQRADDAGAGLRPRRPETETRPVAGRAAAQRALHCRHRDAHRQDDLRPGHRLLREGGLPDARQRRAGGQARYGRPDLSLLHARQARNSETTRRLQADERQAIFAGRVSQFVPQAGISAHQDRAAGDVGERFAGAIGLAYNVPMSAITQLTAEEFLNLPDYPGKQELLDGELISLPPAKLYHSEIARAFQELLMSALPKSRVRFFEGYQLKRGWLIPDVSANWPDQPRGEWFQGSPMIAVEIVSRGN